MTPEVREKNNRPKVTPARLRRIESACEKLRDLARFVDHQDPVGWGRGGLDGTFRAGTGGPEHAFKIALCPWTIVENCRKWAGTGGLRRSPKGLTAPLSSSRSVGISRTGGAPHGRWKIARPVIGLCPMLWRKPHVGTPITEVYGKITHLTIEGIERILVPENYRS
jgi:hypothetical protein